MIIKNFWLEPYLLPFFGMDGKAEGLDGKQTADATDFFVVMMEVKDGSASSSNTRYCCLARLFGFGENQR